MKYAVVGGGIAGLAAALDLAESGATVELFEASDRLGGKVETRVFDDVIIDRGPDAFLARVPWGTDLCRRLGLEGELVSPAQGKAYLWWKDRLRPLPAGLVLGVPSELGTLARAGLLSPVGMVRAALDLVLPTTPLSDQATVGGVVSARFGRQVDERLVDPLLGSINASRTEALSLQAAAPQLADVAAHHRSLLLGLRRQARQSPAATGAPVFFTLPGGLGRLTDALVDRLVELGVRIRLKDPVERLEPRATGAGINGDVFEGAVLASPAFATAAMLQQSAPEAAELLATIDYASVAIALLSYPTAALSRGLDGSGFLVPRGQGLLTTACSWSSAKWAHLASPDRVRLRVSVGRIDDERHTSMSDEEVIGRVHSEMGRMLGVSDSPLASEVARWPRSFPQYGPGHLGRVARIEEALGRALPRVSLAGAALRGVGLPACIASGQAAARRILDL